MWKASVEQIFLMDQQRVVMVVNIVIVVAVVNPTVVMNVVGVIIDIITPKMH